MKELPSQDYLKSILDYDEISGIFIWKDHLKCKRKNKQAGQSCGSDKYIRIEINGYRYMAHRLAWVYFYGFIDDNLQIDHINGIRNDNRICNLRNVTNYENCKNKTISIKNTTGFLGVSFCNTRKKYYAQIRANGVSINLGRYNTLEEAVQVRKAANIKYGYHENHGKKL